MDYIDYIEALVGAYVAMSYASPARLEKGISENFRSLADWMQDEIPDLSVELRRFLVGSLAMRIAQELRGK